MSLTIKIGDQEEEAPEHDPIPVSLAIRKTVDDNLLIFDHPEIDISVIPEKKKIVVFPKERISDKVYDIQNI